MFVVSWPQNELAPSVIAQESQERSTHHEQIGGYRGF
jgi:hypothetical protein